MKKYISLVGLTIFSLVIFSPNFSQGITEYPGIYPTDNLKNYPKSYPTDYYGTDHKTNYYDSTTKDYYSSTSPYTTSTGTSYYPYSTNNSYSNSSNSNSQAIDATKQALIQILTKLVAELQVKLKAALAQKANNTGTAK